ncbi:MAG: ATP-binding cassette domain-containing protein [Candidatus Midichloria sp.]|nr:MAG: ATP-binding cassette domain-containing protein [Candidatus Midichloria sp.]
MYSKVKIFVRNLSKSFDEKVVLRSVNLEIEEGKSLVIIGGSGSGKSVLLKCIIGLLQPDSRSKIFFDGDNIASTHIKNRQDLIGKFGMLFQAGALLDSLPIWYNVCFHMLHQGLITAKNAKALAKQKLKMVGISSEVLDLYPAQLSGGMQKRVGLARAIANSPEIIFFDEPTAGLDPINAQNISELIANLSKELKATTVTITHDMVCMKRIANKIAMIHSGNIIWQGTKENIKNSGNSFVDAFVKAAGNF